MKYPVRWCGVALIAGCLICVAAMPARPNATDPFKVLGHVNNPGIYPFTPGKTTILSALDAAGGEKFGMNLKVFLVRMIDDSLTQEINFSSAASLRKHPNADIPLLPGDELLLMPPPARK